MTARPVLTIEDFPALPEDDPLYKTDPDRPVPGEKANGLIIKSVRLVKLTTVIDVINQHPGHDAATGFKFRPHSDPSSDALWMVDTNNPHEVLSYTEPGVTES